MAKNTTACAQKNWSNVSSSGISAVAWPFRFCDIVKADSCEEVLGEEIWEGVRSKENKTTECLWETWNGIQIKQCRQMIQTSCIGTPHSLGRNLFHMMLLKHFEGRFLAHQGISLRPFEIYVAPCGYTRYNPQIDICLMDPSDDGRICLNVIERCSKHDVEDSMHQAMFYMLSGNRATAYCFVIKSRSQGCFQVFVGKIAWPVKMLQMLEICGSDVSRQLGFNHRKHSEPIIAQYAYLGEISIFEDDCPIVPLFLNLVEVLSETKECLFLPLTTDMEETVRKRKNTGKHVSKCVLDNVELCNHRFEESTSK